MLTLFTALSSFSWSSVLARLRREEAQGLAEYALILFFIAVVAVLALTFLGTQISSLLNQVGHDL